MSKYLNKIICGDCLEVMKEMPDNSVDTIITDPPYELGFMGKEWDKTGIANNVDMWKECLRVLKPGGYLLSFGGTRTYHRMAVAIEDAGFEVRDMIEWVYGSGFPKSLNIGKAVDKLQGNERVDLGISEASRPNSDRGKSGVLKGNGLEKVWNITKGTSEWEGWGTNLKPSHEPICMAMKPLSEKNYVANVLKYGTGGINIDESRVEGQVPVRSDFGKESNSIFGINSRHPDGFREGRFPANLIHDNSEEVRECFPESKGMSSQVDAKETPSNYFGLHKKAGLRFGRGDSGNASRFFKSIIYTAKASKSERNKGCEGLELKPGGSNAKGYTQDVARGLDRNRPVANNHPTVKPLALMEYLINMVTREGQVVLDPFIGSGTTAIACLKKNRKFIGIEKNEEYIKIAEARIDYWKKMTRQDKLL